MFYYLSQNVQVRVCDDACHLYDLVLFNVQTCHLIAHRHRLVFRHHYTAWIGKQQQATAYCMCLSFNPTGNPHTSAKPDTLFISDIFNYMYLKESIIHC